jgi:hypothetical protein
MHEKGVWLIPTQAPLRDRLATTTSEPERQWLEKTLATIAETLRHAREIGVKVASGSDPANAAVAAQLAAAQASGGGAASGVLQDSSFLNGLDERIAKPFLMGFSEAMDTVFLVGSAVMVVGFTILILLTIKVHRDAPPIPERVVDSAGAAVFTGEDILAGQQVFLKHGLMDNGSIWGHGGYLGPDFSAQYLHTLALDVANRCCIVARSRRVRTTGAPRNAG